MLTFRLLLLVIIANVVTGEDTNTTNIVSPEPKNAFKFEDQVDTPQSYGLIRFEGQYDGLEYNPQYTPDNEPQRIKFQDENTIGNQKPTQPKKKRRRRKPRQRFPNQAPGFQNGAIPGYPTRPNPVLPGPLYPGNPYLHAYPGQFYRPRPSASSGALTAVTDALSSIAQYDDRQCVARLLCEAAGGAGGEAGSETGAAGGLLKAITGLQPLLTLLAAYNGISSSPLFVFGRAVFLGMTSRANPGTCRYAYPDCPTDPEQLVHYLNNHNGGFFRFFAAPQNQQQNLEQFYNQLSGQSYGYYEPQQNSQNGYGQLHPNLQQFDHGQSFPQPYPNPNLQQQSLYQNQLQDGGYGQYPQQNYQHLQNSGYQRPSLYNNRYGFYGHGYPYQQNFNYRFKSNNNIEKRIQNTRDTELINDNIGTVNAKWLFPDSSKFNNKDFENVRQGKVLKFPQSNVKSDRAAKGFVFPGSQSNRDYISNNIEAIDDNHFVFVRPSTMNEFRLENYYNNKVHNNYENGDKFENQYNYKAQYNHANDVDDMNDNGVRVLYIVRGNGDPNNPEVVRLTPEQTS